MLCCAGTRKKFMDSLYSYLVAHLSLTLCYDVQQVGAPPLATLQEETYASKLTMSFLTE